MHGDLLIQNWKAVGAQSSPQSSDPLMDLTPSKGGSAVRSACRDGKSSRLQRLATFGSPSADRFHYRHDTPPFCRQIIPCSFNFQGAAVLP